MSTNSCNFYPGFYNGYYSKCNPYRSQCLTVCQPVNCCNPCSTGSYIAYNQCTPTTNYGVTCNPCNVNNPCNPCPNVTYIANPATATVALATTPTVVNPIPIGSTIITGVTPITGFTGTPTSNCGGITVTPSTGQFTIPIAGRYLLSANVIFNANAIAGSDQVYIYRIDATTGVISLLSSGSQISTINIPNRISVSTFADLNPGDRIFFAVTSSNGSTVDTSSRFGITRLC